MSKPNFSRARRTLIVLAGFAAFSVATSMAQAQPTPLDAGCVVFVNNRFSRAAADGSFAIPNVVGSGAPIRLRAICTDDADRARFGASELFSPDAATFDPPPIRFDLGTGTPERLQVTVSPAVIGPDGITGTVQVTGLFADGIVRNLSSGTTGTTYQVSDNDRLAVDEDGALTALGSGTAIVSVSNDGVLGVAEVRLALPGTDSDGDGVDDDVELANGMDPNRAADAFEDLDSDGLFNAEEILVIGTDPQNSDTDGDGLDDFEEVDPGTDGFVTDPLAVDTDGDGIEDGLEVLSGSDPTDPNSPGASLAGLRIEPASFVVRHDRFRDGNDDPRRSFAVIGTLPDGSDIDLTDDVATSFDVNDRAVCTPNGNDGVRLLASGLCTIRATHLGFEATARGVVRRTPEALGTLDLPGIGRDVSIGGETAYVAAAAAGIQVVDLRQPAEPRIVATVPTPRPVVAVATTTDLLLVGDEDGTLIVFDRTDPRAPVEVARIALPGSIAEVAVAGTIAYVASGNLEVVDIAVPTAPVHVATLSITAVGAVEDVAVTDTAPLVVLVDPPRGFHVVDVTDPAQPVVVSTITSSTPIDAAFRGQEVYLASDERIQRIDLTTPSSPVEIAVTAVEGRDISVAGDRLLRSARTFGFTFAFNLYMGFDANDLDFLGLADFDRFRHDQPITHDTNERLIVQLARLEGGINLSEDSTALYVGRHTDPDDTAGLPPSVSLVSPDPNDPLTSLVEGATVAFEAFATDDVAVSRVDLLLDGTLVAVSTDAPHATAVTIPPGASSVVFEARAFDGAGASTTTGEVIQVVAADPGTEATGRVLAADGGPIDGIAVKVGTRTAVTNAEGRFALVDIATVATLRGEVLATVDGETLIGRSSIVEPVAGGVTDLGDIVLRRQPRVAFVPRPTHLDDPNPSAIAVLGYEPVAITDTATFDFSAIDVLLVEEIALPALLDRVLDIESFVAGGGAMIVHARLPQANAVLPLDLFGLNGGVLDLQIKFASPALAEGPVGRLNDRSLDGAIIDGRHTPYIALNPPPNLETVLTKREPGFEMMGHYPFGAGQVIYSAVPLIGLRLSHPPPVRDVIDTLYLPNAIAFADGLRATP